MSIYQFTTPSGFYVYAYLREDGTPYYIGKGWRRRAIQKHCINIPTELSRIVICEQNLTEIGALAVERQLIRRYGRIDLGTGVLRNLTFGGENPDNSSPITRKKMSIAGKGRPKSAEHKMAIGNARRGKGSSILGTHQSEDHKQNISKALKGISKPKVVCRLYDRREFTLANFNKWVNFHHPLSKGLDVVEE